VPTPWKYALWALALAVEHTAPIRAWQMLRDAPINLAHIPERFGLLVIIVLGEAVIAVVLGTAKVNWTVASVAAAFAGFLAAAAIWWLYFDFFDPSVVGRNVVSGITFVYAHYFVTAGIAALGVGVKLTILSAAPGSRYDDIGWIAAAGTAMCMAGLAVIQLAIPPALFDADIALRLGVAALAAVLLGLTGVLSPVAILWILAAALVAQIVAELGAHERHAGAVGPP
jgi:low temperature requirement protein LtrA